MKNAATRHIGVYSAVIGGIPPWTLKFEESELELLEPHIY